MSYTQIPKTFIQELVERIDIVDWIDARVPLKKMGANYKACCPFHQEKTPSFIVNPKRQLFHCFGCGAKGNIISFVMQYERKSFPEAIEWLAGSQGLSTPATTDTLQQSVKSVQRDDAHLLMKKVADFYQRQLKISDDAIQYLKMRGLTGLICKQFQIGFAPAAWDALIRQMGHSREMQQQLLKLGLILPREKQGFYDRFRDRIMFPILDRRGRVVGFGGRVLRAEDEPKYLNSPETFLFKKNEELYGLHHVLTQRTMPSHILVVEGYFDVVQLAQQDIHYAVATLGTSLSRAHISRLLKVVSHVVFCFDADAAGRKAAWRAAELVLPYLSEEQQFSFLFLPEGEDPDSFVRQHGKEVFEAYLAQQSILWSDFFFNSLLPESAMTHIEARAAVAKKIVNYLDKIPQNTFRLLLFEQLSQLVRMRVESLQEIGKKFPAKRIEKNQQHVSVEHLPIVPRIALPIALLLQHPAMIKPIMHQQPIDFSMPFPGMSILQQLMVELEKSHVASAAAWLEFWRDHPLYPQLIDLAEKDLLIQSQDIQRVWLQAVERIRRMTLEYHVAQLLQKAKQTLLTVDEKKALNAWLLDLKRV